MGVTVKVRILGIHTQMGNSFLSVFFQVLTVLGTCAQYMGVPAGQSTFLRFLLGTFPLRFPGHAYVERLQCGPTLYFSSVSSGCTLRVKDTKPDADSP